MYIGLEIARTYSSKASDKAGWLATGICMYGPKWASIDAPIILLLQMKKKIVLAPAHIQ